ncbi:TerB family tellurite resistance protein [Glaciecola sp. XM2]|uniref:tellurite resistance TerB family protein n=1 Tax=Glaciecola sp. XM2 TaxID=1914931 RepID=UPI001BDF709B|nr:TerB family tellurite resistance protein [Glaciecola sp. XM2]MBT1451770.1 TerB family tellurite resistance protein [Glaciecola sp. XM2]
MLKKLKDLFSMPLEADNAEDKDKKIQQACAVLLIEVALADFEHSESEQEKVKHLLQKTFDLNSAELDELVEFSHSKGAETTSVHPFTSLINEHYDYPQRVNLVKLMWKVAYADGNLDKYEDNIIRKVSDLLYVAHSDFIKAKLSVVEA